MSTAPRQSTPGHVARYEELRRHAVEQQILAGRLGLAILLRLPSAERSRPSPLPDDTSMDVINVLAAMALGHMQEVHA